MHQLVLIRHGESQWNKENRFTGWTYVDLTPVGIDEARRAGRLLRAEGYDIDGIQRVPQRWPEAQPPRG